MLTTVRWSVWSAVKRILNWEGGGPPSQLFYQGKMMNKPAAVASAINSFFIKKVKDIISGIPRVDTDPLTKLRVLQPHPAARDRGQGDADHPEDQAHHRHRGRLHR